jgi:hypothetical protein
MLKPKVAMQRCFLLAGDSVKTLVGKTKTQVPERTRTADIRILYQLASDYDAISPNLSAQLRGIAGRL